jgi:hypothetical protein
MSNTFLIIGQRKVAAERIIQIQATISGVEITLDDNSIYNLPGYSAEEMVALVNSAREESNA